MRSNLKYASTVVKLVDRWETLHANKKTMDRSERKAQENTIWAELETMPSWCSAYFISELLSRHVKMDCPGNSWGTETTVIINKMVANYEKT